MLCIISLFFVAVLFTESFSVLTVKVLHGKVRFRAVFAV